MGTDSSQLLTTMEQNLAEKEKVLNAAIQKLSKKEQNLSKMKEILLTKEQELTKSIQDIGRLRENKISNRIKKPKSSRVSVFSSCCIDGCKQPVKANSDLCMVHDFERSQKKNNVGNN